MTLEEFRIDLLENIRLLADANRDFLHSCFLQEASGKLVDAEEIVDFTFNHFEGKRNRKNLLVDGYSFDDVDNSFSVFVGDFSNDTTITNISVTEAKALFNQLQNFLDCCLAGMLTDGSIEDSDPTFGLAATIMDFLPIISKFKLYLVTDKIYKTTNRKWEVGKVGDVNCEFHIWDISRFHDAHISKSGRDELRINFSNYSSSGLTAIKAGKAEGEYDAYLCMIPGEILADIYNEYGSRLLEGNVRSFLSVKGKVNKGIQNTLIDHPEMFFAYNNGITATAEDISAVSDGKTISIKEIINLQIVNGGQTTASLGTAKRRSIPLDKVFVQMKLSVLPPNKAQELIPKISRFANMQNKVSDADFFANHPYHIRMEDFSRRIWSPAAEGMQHGTHWYYERARGQYLNDQAGLSASQKKNFISINPKSQLLTKTDLAKFVNTFRILPHTVSLGGQKNFINFAQFITEQWDKNESFFDEKYFKDLVSKAILFKNTEELINDQTWFQKSYRANIVTYSLAKMQDLIEKQARGKELNLKKIWDTQKASESILNQLEIISESVFKILLDPSRHKENVTEWAKHSQCLTKIQNLHITLEKNFIKELIDIETQKKKKVEIQNILDLNVPEHQIIKIQAFEWANLLKFGLENRVLNKEESDLIKLAILIPSKMPSEGECMKILEIRRRLKQVGFGD